VGRDNIDSIATRYSLEGPGIESRCGQDFPYPSRPELGSTQSPMQCVPGHFRGGGGGGGGGGGRGGGRAADVWL